jgi:hypothetical protein
MSLKQRLQALERMLVKKLPLMVFISSSKKPLTDDQNQQMLDAALLGHPVQHVHFEVIE